MKFSLANTASHLTKQQFYIEHKNKKFQMFSYQQLLRNIILKLLMRGERKRNFQLYFTIYLLSLIGRKSLINIAVMQSYRQLIVLFLSLRFLLLKKARIWQLLNLTDPEKCNPQVKMLSGLFKETGQHSNNNIIRNTDFLLSKHKTRVENIPWVGANKKKIWLDNV